MSRGTHVCALMASGSPIPTASSCSLRQTLLHDQIFRDQIQIQIQIPTALQLFLRCSTSGPPCMSLASFGGDNATSIFHKERLARHNPRGES